MSAEESIVLEVLRDVLFEIERLCKSIEKLTVSIDELQQTSEKIFEVWKEVNIDD